MADVMTQQLVQSLKNYFKKDEFSDKTLRIIEIDDMFDKYSTSNSPSNGKRVLETDKNASSASSTKKIKFNETVDSAIGSPTESTPLLSSTPIRRKVTKQQRSTEEPGTSSSTPESLDEAVVSDNIANEKKCDPTKLFQDVSFCLSRNNDPSVLVKIKSRGGAISSMKCCDFIISDYATVARKKPDTRERTVKWLLDSIRDNEIKASFVDVLYRPVQVKNKPLSGCIVALDHDHFSKREKESLAKLIDCLGASTQDLVFAKNKNQSMTACTHLIVKQTNGLPYEIAQQWEIPCVTEDWVFKCIETQSKIPFEDFLVKKTEVKSSSVTSETESDIELGLPYSVFPVHSLILCINSPYFKTLISDSGMKETKQKEIVVKVNKGEGKYFELLIHSFYDQDILKDMEPLDLLKVLETADRFLCDVFIKRGLMMMKKLNIKSVEQCNVILDHILLSETLGSLSANETYTCMKQFCSKFLADLLSPLESKIDKHGNFEEMSFDSLHLLLQSGRTFLWSENSLIYFIVNWLAADEERQTEENIKALLAEVRYEQMSAEFLHDVLSPNHTILTKWSDYIKWYVDALSFHAFSLKSKRLRDFPLSRKNRSITSYKTDIQNCMIKLCHISDGGFKQSWVNYRNVVFQGYVLTPMVIITDSEEDDRYKVKLHMFLGSSCKEKVIEKFFFELDIAFALLPGNINYDSTDLFTHSSSSFINRHYRPIRIKFEKKNHSKHLTGSVDGKLLERFKEHGLFAAFGFKSADVNCWPAFMKSFQNLPSNSLHRKSSQKFDQYDFI